MSAMAYCFVGLPLHETTTAASQASAVGETTRSPFRRISLATNASYRVAVLGEEKPVPHGFCSFLSTSTN